MGLSVYLSERDRLASSREQTETIIQMTIKFAPDHPGCQDETSSTTAAALGRDVSDRILVHAFMLYVLYDYTNMLSFSFLVFNGVTWTTKT